MIRRAIIALIVGACLSGCSKTNGAKEAEKTDERPPAVVELATAETRPIEITVAAQGTLASGQGAIAHIAPAAAGRLLEVRVREGEQVRAGQVVAIVDERPQQAQARSAAAALHVSEAQARQAELTANATATDQVSAVHLARLTLNAAEVDRKSSVLQAQTALQAAETDLQKTKAGARPQEIAQAEQAVVQAKATRDRAASEKERVQFLFEKGIAARRQVQDAETALTVANSTLETARQQVSLTRAGARIEDIRAAELKVQQAKETLDQAKLSGEAKVAQAQAALRQAEQSAGQVAAKRQEAQAMRASVVQKRADLASAQATAGYAELRAPFAGIVTRRSLNPGDMADVTTPVVEIADPRALNLIANLPGDEGAKVRVGMGARITASDAPGRVFGGCVLSVGQIDPQTNLLAVRIGVTNSSGVLKAGEFAFADIIIRREPGAVVVPKQAVLARENKNVVFVVGADKLAHERTVTTGAEKGDLVAITQGLKAGEHIVRLGQYELTDGAAVREAEKNTEGETKEDKEKDGVGKEGANKKMGEAAK